MGADRNRWWIVFASVIGLLVGNGPIMQFTFGVLLPPIGREFGWARGTVSSAIVVGLWMTGIARRWLAGSWIDTGFGQSRCQRSPSFPPPPPPSRWCRPRPWLSQPCTR